MTVKHLFKIVSSKDPKTPIQFKFLCWLFIYASTAFILSLILSLTFATLSAKSEVRQIIQSKIKEAYEHSKLSDESLKTIKDMESEIGVQRARALSFILQSDPSVIVPDDPKKTTINLGKIARLLNVNEIDVSDENGFLIASWPNGAAKLGWSYASETEASKFLTILSDPSVELSQDIRPREGAIDSAFYQYSAVARRDRVGIVQIGFRVDNVKEAYRLADLSNYINSVVGYDGFLWVYRNPLSTAVAKNSECSNGNVEAFFNKKDETSSSSSTQLSHDGQISGPTFSITSVEKLNCIPPEELVALRLSDAASERATPYLVYAQDLFLGEDDIPYRFVGGISQREVYRSRRLLVYLLILANFIVFFIVFTLISKLVKSLIVDSVHAVNHSLEKITKGDPNERVNVNVSKEFIDLSNGVNATVDSLKHKVEEVNQSSKRELLLPRRIQEASLPNLERLYSKYTEYDVYAKNRPMQIVGGDMYDFFYLDNKRIMFYVADVSGHGIPGSLFMMKTMAFVKNLALSGYSLDRVVTITNIYLSDNNDSSFVTGFFCVVDLRTGDLTYVNAGHNPPFIRQGSGVFMEFEPKINLLLGIEPSAEYVSQTIKLNPGDIFVLFTDGVTEATTPSLNNNFEVSRALETLNNAPSNTKSKDYVMKLFDAIAHFTGNEEPSDDETVLFFHFLKRQD